MRRLVYTAIIALGGFTYQVQAQDTIRVNALGKNVVTVVERGAKSDVSIGNNAVVVKSGDNDSVKVRIGRKAVVVTEGKNGADVKVLKLDDEAYEKWTGRSNKFKGHWSLFEIGLNSFARVDYKGYTPNFMDLNQNKSYEIGLNFLRYSIGIQKVKKNIGLVTGMGLTFNDYRFSNPFTIKNVNGAIQPVALDPNTVSKTKLSTLYLSVPLIMEFQVPVEGHDHRFYISGGLIGGLKLGSHTKTIIEDHKSKDRGDLNINPFRYGTTARIGYKGLNVFGTYYFSTLFRNDRGPDLTPFTIGIGILH